MASRRTKTLVAGGVVVGLGALAFLLSGKASAAGPEIQPGGFDPGPVPPDEEPLPTLEPVEVPGMAQRFAAPTTIDEPLIPGIEPQAQPAANTKDVAREFHSNAIRHGRLWEVKKGYMFGGKGKQSIAYQALLDAGRQAAVEVGGLQGSAAEAFAKEIANANPRRAQYRDLIQCGYWNDLHYGTWGYGPKALPGPHGRAIRLLRQHANNRSRLQRGDPSVRNIEIGRPSDKGLGNAFGIDKKLREAYEYLWLPQLNLDELWHNRRVTTDDTRLGIDPPDAILTASLEVLEPDNLQGRTFGCLGAEAPL